MVTFTITFLNFQFAPFTFDKRQPSHINMLLDSFCGGPFSLYNLGECFLDSEFQFRWQFLYY